MRQVVTHALWAVTIALVACTGNAGLGTAPRQSDVRLSGSVLARTEVGRALVVIDPDDRTERAVEMPPDSVLVHLANFSADGSIVAVVEGPYGRIGAYRLGVGRDPQALGPMLRGVFTFDGDDRFLLAASCDKRRAGYLLDVADPLAWHEVTARCGAALSPDGASIATVVDGTTVDVVAVEGSKPASTAFSLVDTVARSASVPRDAVITGQIAWDEQGLAFTLGTDEVEAVVVVPNDGRARIGEFAAHADWIETTLLWQPDGSLIGAAGATQIEGVVRVADAATGDAQVVAILREPPFGIVWSPDGRVLLAATLGRWAFLAPDGAWLRVLPYSRGRALPMDWRT